MLGRDIALIPGLGEEISETTRPASFESKGYDVYPLRQHGVVGCEDCGSGVGWTREDRMIEHIIKCALLLDLIGPPNPPFVYGIAINCSRHM